MMGIFFEEYLYQSRSDKIKKLVNELDVNKFDIVRTNSYPFRITNILPKHSELKKIVENQKSCQF